MTSPFLRAYTLHCTKVCHARKIAAIGGMAAQIPIKNDERANRKALELVRKDKEREACDGELFSISPRNFAFRELRLFCLKSILLRSPNKVSVGVFSWTSMRRFCQIADVSGHDGTWVAHPDLVKIAKDVFDEFMPTPNQISKQLMSHSVNNRDLTAVPEGSRTDFGFKRNISVTVGMPLLSWIWILIYGLWSIQLYLRNENGFLFCQR